MSVFIAKLLNGGFKVNTANTIEEAFGYYRDVDTIKEAVRGTFTQSNSRTAIFWYVEEGDKIMLVQCGFGCFNKQPLELQTFNSLEELIVGLSVV